MQFSPEVLNKFDYLFTDAMTVVDKGRICRIYRPDEVHLDGRSKQQYMDMIVDQTVKILTNEPADIYANATYIPESGWMEDYDQYWTDERVDKVLDVLQKYDIALEISPRYKIPSFNVIKKAKARGLKFTFGTNNVNADFGRCERLRRPRLRNPRALAEQLSRDYVNAGRRDAADAPRLLRELQPDCSLKAVVPQNVELDLQRVLL